MFVSDEQLRIAVASQLQKRPVDLADWWDEIVLASNQRAYWEIVGRLSARGYSKAQIDAWDRGYEFQRSIGLWYAIKHGQAMSPDTYSGAGIDGHQRLTDLSGDQQKEIQPVIVTTAGEFVVPERTTGNVVLVAQDTTTDMFASPIDQDDPRVGKTMRS